MTTCIIESCDNESSEERGHKYCKSCYFKRRNSRRGRRKSKGYFRMIVHEQCSSNGTSTTASHSKICGVCGSPSDVGSQIVFQTICSECAKLKPHGALIARNEPPEFDDFCIDCKRIIPSSNKSPSPNQVPKVTEEEAEPKEPSVTLKEMVKDLSRILNGVTKIKRNTLLKRLIKECDYSKKDASIAISSVLGLYSYSEEDGMILFNS